MTMTDGWVGEKISDDHTVVPALGNADSSGAVQAQASPTTATESTSSVGAVAKLKPTKQNAEAKDRSGLKKATGGVVVAAVLAVGGVIAWPYISDLLAEPEVLQVAAPQAPTQRFVIEGDTLYLEGMVPSEEVSEAFQGAAEGALGVDRVVNNFEVSDDAVYDPGKPVQLTVAETVLFSTGRADISDRYGPLIDLAVELLESQDSVTLTVVGHTDSNGDENQNLLLSEQRAQAAATEIASRGVSADRISTEGRGETEPLATNDTEEGRQFNRRVEFLVTGLSG